MEIKPTKEMHTVLDAKQISEELEIRGYPFSAERIIELARQELIPFVLVDGKELRFFKKRTVDYIKQNLVFEKEPIPFPKPYPVYLNEPAPYKDIPMALRGMSSFLYRVDSPLFLCGVYFLCSESAVVYVGSSTNIFSRVISHGNRGHDKSFYIIVPEKVLMAVEGAFIKILKPEQNKVISVHQHKEKIWVAAENEFKTPEEIIDTYVGCSLDLTAISENVR